MVTASERQVEAVTSTHQTATRSRRVGLTVALVGPDGAGKSTISARLATADLPRPVKTIYMGVNLEASSMMLPTTRLMLAVKKARGGRPDLVASSLRDVEPGDVGTVSDGTAVRRSAKASAKEAARLGVWMLEEWLRQAIASWHTARGRIVVFDRHFFADYYHADVQERPVARGPVRRLHGWMLAHAYPKPDLVIMLDAPAEVLYSRKQEATVDWLEQRRLQYLELAAVVPEFVVVDVDRPLEAAVADTVEAIRTSWKVRAG
jgi:thymidylate kinase